MTIQDLINWLSVNQYYVLGYFATILIIAFIMITIVNQKNIGTVKYFMSSLVFGVAIPGMLAIFLLLYNVLFLKANILKLSIISYFLPILATVFTLIILNRKVKMSKLPGFSKLSSLFIMIAITFGIIFVLQRTYFGVLILGSFIHVIVVFAVLMIILRIAWKRLAG